MLTALTCAQHVTAPTHPQWCDPQRCLHEPNFGNGLTHTLHRGVLLDSDGWRVEVERSVVHDPYGLVSEDKPGVFLDGPVGGAVPAQVAARLARALAEGARLLAASA